MCFAYSLAHDEGIGPCSALMGLGVKQAVLAWTAGPIGGIPVPQFPACGEDNARIQLHARQLSQAAAHTPAPHVAGLGHGRRDVPPAAAAVSASQDLFPPTTRMSSSNPHAPPFQHIKCAEGQQKVMCRKEPHFICHAFGII